MPKYVLCTPSGWGNSFPVLQWVEHKTPEEVHADHELWRQLQNGWFWMPLDQAKRRFPNNMLLWSV